MPAPKNNATENKAQVSLIPLDLIIPMLEPAYREGIIKYQRESWRLGFNSTVMYDALMRHLKAWFFDLESYDPETKEKYNIDKHHLGAVLFCAINLYATEISYPEIDDRPLKLLKKSHDLDNLVYDYAMSKKITEEDLGLNDNSKNKQEAVKTHVGVILNKAFQSFIKSNKDSSGYMLNELDEEDSIDEIDIYNRKAVAEAQETIKKYEKENTIRFEDGNEFSYGQDFAVYRGIPAGIDFEVTVFNNEAFQLRAPGYGKQGDYGNGCLYIYPGKDQEILSRLKAIAKLKE